MFKVQVGKKNYLEKKLSVSYTNLGQGGRIMDIYKISTLRIRKPYVATGVMIC